MNSKLFWSQVSQALHKHKKIFFSIVIHHSKGSPGRKGFKMITLPTGACIGTVGGGIMEMNLQEDLYNQLNRKEVYLQSFTEHLYHNKSVPKQNQSGLICAGQQSIKNFYLTELENRPIINDILSQIDQKSESMIDYSKEYLCLTQTNPNTTSKESFVEPLRHKFRVFIIGGGHVGAALGRTIRGLSMESYLFDHRKNIGSLFDLGCWDHVHLGSFEKIQQVIKPIPWPVYACVVSTSMQTDYHALKQLLQTKVTWIGLMGAPAKVKAIKNLLLDDGFSLDDIKRIKAPIGIDINSQAADEISISICAQLIQFKNQDDF